MPLTPAEKSKRYRERLRKDNPEKFEALQKKNLERTKELYKKKVAGLTEENREERRRKWKESNKQRHNPKLTKPEQTITSNTTQNETSQNTTTTLNESIARNIQRRVERNLRKENTELRKSVISLQNGYNRLFNQLKIQQQQLNKMHENCEVLLKKLQKAPNTDFEKNISDCQVEDTPQKKTDNFVNENIPDVDTLQKNKVKKVILAHNVLTEALRNEYSTSSNHNKNKLKNMMSIDLLKKYKMKTNMTKILGLKTGFKKYRRNTPKNNLLRKQICLFYEQDDVSRASAGKKECKTFKKCKKQKRYLLDTLSNMHKKYIRENGPIGLTTFKRYRPFYVVSPRIKDLETCACSKHCNMQLMANVLKSHSIIKTNDLYEIISENVCDIQFKNCMYGMCDICSEKGIEEQVENFEQTTWLKYTLKDHEYTDNKGNKKKTRKMVKQEQKGTVNELIKLFNSDMKKFKTHLFNVIHQYQQYKTCIKDLESNEIVVHIDFSENWVCKHNEEVQSMHFGSSKNQITLHTGVFYIKDTEKPFSFCSISPDNVHNPEAIWAHLDPILKYIKLHYPGLETIHFFSDGPTTQYRQKKNFFLFSNNILQYGFNNATWSFFEASHGKGAADGIGGAVKRTLDLKVAHGLDIPDAETAFKVLKETETKVKIFYVGTENINPLDSNIVTQLFPLQDTMKIHQVVLMDKHLLSHRVISCFCQKFKGKCGCYSPKLHRFEIKESIETESDYELELNEITGTIQQVKKRDGENEQVVIEDEGVLDCINLEELDLNENFLNDSLVSFVERNMDILDENSDGKCPKRKQIGNKSKDNKPKRTKINKYSSEENLQYSVHDSSSELDYLEYDSRYSKSDEEMENSDPNTKFQGHFKEDSNTDILTTNSYVLVKFKLEKSTKFYLGHVVQILGKCTYEVKFLRHKGNGRFVWPVHDDISLIDKSDIEKLVSKPFSDRRGIKKFDISILKYKIE